MHKNPSTCLLFATMTAAISLSAAATRTLQAVEGDFSGDWSDTAHWTGGVTPQSGEVAAFPDNETATVNVDCAATCGYFTLASGGESRLVDLGRDRLDDCHLLDLADGW